MRLGLVGKKIGMTQKFYESGEAVPVTVLQVEPGKIVEVIEKDKRGYSALLVGYGHIKSSKLTKSMKGFYAKKSLEAKKFLKEYRVESTEEFKAGSDVTLDILKDKKYVDIRSKTIGKGFAGVMKRWNFGGLRATHGVSVSHRSHGSTGQRQDPRKVFKGKKMAGHMGDVIGDLNSRRGQTSEQESRGNATVITAMVPLANMFGYINSLRSMSQGRAQYSMFFDHYSKVPQNVQDEVTKKIAG